MSWRKCCISSCQKSTKDGIRLYGFPKTVDLARKWSDWIAKENNSEVVSINKNSLLCSDHFSDEFKGSRKLIGEAIPSISSRTDQVAPKNDFRNPIVTYTSITEIDMTNCFTQQQNDCVNEVVDVSHIEEDVNMALQQIKQQNLAAQSTEEIMTSIKTNSPSPILTLEYGCNQEVENITNQDIFIDENNQIYYFQSNVEFDFANVANECDKNHNQGAMAIENIVPDVQPCHSSSFLEEISPQIYPENQNQGDMAIGNMVSDIQPCHSSLFQEEKISLQTLPEAHQLRAHSNKNEEAIGKSRQRLCAAAGCINSSKASLHKFPSIVLNGQLNCDNLERCKQWIKLSGNSKLVNEHTSKVSNRFVLCANHFDDTQYYNKKRKRLLPTAIPSLLLPDPLSETEMMAFPRWSAQDMFFDLALNGETIHDNCPDINQSQNINEDNLNMNPINQGDAVESEHFETDIYQRSFEDTLISLEWRICLKYENGMDPGDVPPELQNLSPTEEQLISKIHPVLQVYKVKGHQLGYHGNIINFPQDVKGFANKLPHNINEMTSIIKVRTSKDAKNYKDFNVRANIVRTALKWLQKNNPYYFDVQISEDNMSLLPEDGNVYDCVQSIDAEGDEQEGESDNEAESVVGDGTLIETNLPMFAQPAEEDQINSAINWPTISNKPIDEFKTVGYIAQAFPCLFPWGKADIYLARENKVSETNYFQHMMRYHDDRFARHNRFRFFALNSLMRWAALKDGNIFVKRNPELSTMRVSDLQKKLEEDPGFMKKMMFQASNIRGTKAFWHARGRELQAMIEQLSLPTLFVTLSAADLHWPELFKILAPNGVLDNLTEFQRRQLIQENPMAVDEFFLTRAEVFLEKVLKHKFKIKDFWFRIEYQHRGSPHLHGVLWLKNAPDVTKLVHASEEQKQEIIDYFDNLISTMHPNINEPPAPNHPCRVKLSEVVNAEQDLAQLLNRVQRHTVCTPGYCLKGDPAKCRFNFPAEMRESTILDYTDINNIKLLTKRNDSRLNKYNSYIIQTWRGNIDVSPVLSKRALINYLAKYISKSETRSQPLIDLMRNIISKSDESKPAKHVIQRLFIQTCSERDYSAQETCHILMGLKLYSTSGRKFLAINFNNTTNWIRIQSDGSPNVKSFPEKYKERPEEMGNMCMWNMAKMHNVKNIEKFNIIQVYPRIRFNPVAPDNEEFYKQQCLLFLPWRNEDQLLDSRESWNQLYDESKDIIQETLKDFTLLTGEPDEDVVYDEYETEILGNEQWMALSMMGPHHQYADVELGFREMDLDHNWHQYLQDYQECGGLPYLQNFVHNAKATFQNSFDENEELDVNLSEEQQKVIDLVQLQVNNLTKQLPFHSENEIVPKRVMVQGKAGTGKSLVISRIQKLVETSFGQGSIKILGPTGVSAVNISGSTVHSKLKINTRSKEFLPLRGQAAHDLKTDFEMVKFIIIDEYSMIGCGLLNRIDQRLRQATGNSTEDFGGLNVYLFGDIKQLSPVADCSAYSNNQSSLETIRGKQIYENFETAFFLTKIHRQNDEAFLNVLNNISQGKVTAEDYKLLTTRFITSVTSEDRQQFRNALHLFPKTTLVNDFNKNVLENLKDEESHQPVPVVRLPGKHNCEAAKKGTVNDAEGLEAALYLAPTAKVMLRVNMWTERGLVNGAMGTIVDILYHENSHPSEDLPAVLICHFSSYKGPYLDASKKTVPIMPVTRSWVTDAGTNCSREQFPITLAYATSIHKSQGLTLEKAVVDIGSKEMAPGLSYVAMSRVKSLPGLLLQPFSYKRLKSLSTSPAIKRRLAWERNLHTKNY